MAKYKVKHTSIMHNGKLYKEGSVVELTDEQAQKLADFVDIVLETKKAEATSKTAAKTTNTKSNKTAAKTKTEVKTETKTETSAPTGEDSNGGTADGK
ncbi:hypothetical protein IJG72_05985 [bacterium]|nr:hypothetical protein [bacterium]